MEEIHFENGFKYIGTRDSKGVMQKHGVLSNEGVKKAIESARDIPGYLSVEQDGFAGKMLAHPAPEQISFPLTINIPMICEFLAHTT